MACIYYCNGLLYGVTALHLSKLQRLRLRIPQRDLITHTPRYGHINPVLLALHWLLVKFRICYKIAVISFKAIYNLGPPYLSNLINIKRCSRYSLRSNVGVILQDPTAKFKCALRDRSFTAAAPKMWNCLPDYIKKRMILICLRDWLRRTILKRPNATCLELSKVFIFYFYLLFLLLNVMS